MKRPIIEPTNTPQEFKRLSPIGYSVKDASFFTYQGDKFMMCTYENNGLIVFKMVNGKYQFFQKLFTGWSLMWAPTVIEQENGILKVLCSDTFNSPMPFWVSERLCYFNYIPGIHPANPIKITMIGNEMGMIDPDVIKINGIYYLFYVIMDWNNGEWWDVYYSTSTSLTGPYYGRYNISQMQETGIEEAPCVIGDKLYWSSENSSFQSYISRGDLIIKNGAIEISQDMDIKIEAINSITCTHPSNNFGNLAATLKTTNEFFIAELLI